VSCRRVRACFFSTWRRELTTVCRDDDVCFEAIQWNKSTSINDVPLRGINPTSRQLSLFLLLQWNSKNTNIIVFDLTRYETQDLYSLWSDLTRYETQDLWHPRLHLPYYLLAYTTFDRCSRLQIPCLILYEHTFWSIIYWIWYASIIFCRWKLYVLHSHIIQP
jgi:hypothetical protein